MAQIMYQIRIEKLTAKGPDDKGYDRTHSETIYQQMCEELDVPKLIRLINR